MPIKIACPKCNKRYSLPDSARGKKVKCSACGATFRTAAAPAQTSDAPTAAKPVQEDLGQFGIDGGFAEQSEIFGSAPPKHPSVDLGNFAAEDSSFDQDIAIPGQKKQAAEENPFQSVLHNPALRTGETPLKKRGGKKGGASSVRRKHIKQETEIREWGLILIVLNALGILVMLGYLIYAMVQGLGFAIWIFAIIIAVGIFFNGLQILVGWGMASLNGIGRIGGTIVFGINLLNIPVGTVIGIMVLRLLWNEDANTIFSPEYREIRAATPEIKHKSSTAGVVIGIIIGISAVWGISYLFSG